MTADKLLVKSSHLIRPCFAPGMHPIEFQKLLANRGICVHYDVEEFEQDIQLMRDRGWL